MNRISSTPNLNKLLWQEPGSDIQTSLPDNWTHLRKMAHSRSVPRLIAESMEPTTGSETAYSIDHNCLDCQGNEVPRHNMAWNKSSVIHQDDHRMSCSSSSEGLEDGCEDGASKPRSMSIDSGISATNADGQLNPYDDACRVRTMSIDDAISEDEEDANNVVIRITLNEPDAESESEPEPEPEPEQEANTSTTRGQETSPMQSLAPESSFFNLVRRASFDNGVFGVQDRILSGEMGCGVTGTRHLRNALSAPGSPVPGELSPEAQLVDPQQVFNRIYNLLCAERVTQMTKTYNDIEAVTRLLEEKERDLELAARIGQTLLSKNKELTSRGDTLDEQLTYANDKINQLKHDVSMKDELLKFYCEDLQDQSPDDSTDSPGGGPNLGKINVDHLQKKVVSLEDENISLRLESAQLRTDTETYEEKEKKLVEDCLEQLADVNNQMETFAGELKLKTEESSRQKEEVTSLLYQVADLHKRVRQLTVENMDLSEKLQASRESQRQLTRQLSGQQDRYDELFEMLEEAQDELRVHRNRDNPKARRHLYASAALPGASSPLMNSLASELEISVQQDDNDRSQRRAHSWKVFETARAARKAASKSSRSSSVRMSTSVSLTGSQFPSNINSDNESFNSDGYSADMDSIYGSNSELGRPGIPGSNDLESALRRLALRRANEMNEHEFMASHQTRSECLSPPATGLTPDGRESPASCYSYLGESNTNYSAAQFKMSDKLQIVKPLEGSVTLRHWQRLAQPHLGGLFEHREGVKVKGERKLDLEGEVYTLSDFEEDDEVECPSRRVADSSTIYTFTNSVASHPGEQSQMSESWSSGLQMLATSTPTSQSLVTKSANSSSGTYTMSLGLAAILQERGASTTSTGSVARPIASCSVMPPRTAAQATPASSASAGADTTDSVTGAGLFGKLINTGYSLLWNKSDCPVSSAPQPVSSGLTTQSSPQHLAGASSSTQPKSKDSEVLSVSSTGVLGAIATFRKNGIL